MSTLSNLIKFVKLTQGQYVIVDKKDFKRVSMFKWHAHKGKTGFYAGGNTRIGPGRIKAFRTTKMHRFIVGAKKGEMVDHIDHDTLDNRSSNLRRCSHTENTWNSFKRKENKSGFKGVNFHKASGQWLAQISACDGKKRKNVYLGIFRYKIDAAKAYDRAAKKYRGEYARLNFPD